MAAVPNYASYPGPGDFTPSDREDRISERAGEIRFAIENDPKRLAALDSDIVQDLEGSIVDALFSAVADLHGVSADKLIGSDALARLYRLGRDMATARESRLREHALEKADEEAELAQLRSERRRPYSLRIATPEQVQRCGSAFPLSADEE